MHLMISIGKRSGNTKEISLTKNTNCYYGINESNILILNGKFSRICSVLIRNVKAYTKGFKYVDLEIDSIEGENIVI